jgi:hypothetical protein
MSALAVDDDERTIGAVVFPLDAALQLEHYGAGGVDDFNVVLLCLLVGLGRFAMSAKQDLPSTEFTKGSVVDGLQTKVAQAVAFTLVVYNVSEAIERIAV